MKELSFQLVLDLTTVFWNLNDDFHTDPLLGGFTQINIMEYMKIASENKATYCVAILLDYQNDRFGSVNLLCGFTLDQLD